MHEIYDLGMKMLPSVLSLKSIFIVLDRFVFLSPGDSLPQLWIKLPFEKVKFHTLSPYLIG